MGAGTKFLLLLWKNYLIQKRKIVLTLFEVGVPALFALILVLIRQRIVVTNYEEPHIWASFSVDKLDGSLTGTRWALGYAPKTPVTTRLAERVADRLGMNLTNRGQDLGFLNESALVDYLKQDDWRIMANVLGGIVFSGGLTEDGGNLTAHVQYKIRLRAARGSRINLLVTSDWYTELMFPLRPDIKPRSNSTRGGSPNYASEGFLALQRATDLAITEEIGGAPALNASTGIDIKMQRFPYPKFIDDRFILVIQQQFPFIILLSFIITAANIVKDVVLEKERKLKESMKMMGMANWLHWSAWLVKYLIFLLVSVIVMTFLFCVKLGEGAILTYSDGSLIFVFLIVYCLSIISMCFAVSTLFSKANSGAAAGCILYLVSYIPYFFLQSRYSSLSLAAKVATCLFNNVAMAFGCQQIGFYESTGEGLQWNNFFKPVNVDDTFTMAHVLLMLLVDTVFYAIITWYFDAVMPGDYGVPKPPYFPFTRKYWCGSSTSKVEDNDVEMEAAQDSPFFEKDPTDLTAGISIHNLRKVFVRGGAEKVAVNDLRLNMYEGQITALLGHNGAGKTTTISMLTGFLPPSAGSAQVNGHNIRTDIEGVRASLGLCPQHDVLFDELTVKEHLTFFAKLKGCSGSVVKEEVTKTIKMLNLEPKTDTQSKGLSGGMKRKLSVGIALIGGSKVVILDEPTSGMDPEARRQTWDLLQEQRAGRTMVLTTHFMDEADLLGDRIAIMAEGTIQCSGSSLFLKNKYGVGYHMVMVKEAGCDVSRLSDVIMKHVPGAQLESNISAELSFVLPHESSSSFEALFAYLEANRKQLGISSYGASVTTLEEVFLKVGESMDETLQKRLQKGGPDEAVVQADQEGATGQLSSTEQDLLRFAATEAVMMDDVSPSTFSSGKLIIEPDNWHPDTHKKISSRKYSRQDSTQTKSVFGAFYNRKVGPGLYAQQFKALFIKRVIHSWRNRLVTLTQLLVPLFFTMIGCIVLKTFPSSTDDPPPLSLSMKSFTEQVVLYETSPNLTDRINKLAEDYIYVMSKTQQGVSQVESVSSVMSEVLSVGEASMGKYNRDYMVAAGFDNQLPVENVTNATTAITAYFNNQAYHTIAISLSMTGNTLLRYLTGESDHTIETINHPVPRTSEQLLEQDMASQLVVAFVVAYNIMFGMAFLVGTFSVFLIKERQVKSKHIQYVSGVHSTTYWLSTFTWDFLNYLLPASLLLLVFLAFQVDAYITGNNLAYIFLIFLLYGWAVLPFIYLLSHLFTVPATGYVWITVLNIFTGTAAVLAILILSIPQLGTEDVAKVLQWVFYALLPNFAFGNSLQDFFINYESKRSCTKDGIQALCELIELVNRTNGCCPNACGDNCIVWQDNALSMESPGIGRACLFLTMHGFIFMAAIFVMESGAVSRVWQRVVEGANTQGGADTQEDQHVSAMEAQVGPDGALHALLEEDADVTAERTRISETPLETLVASDALVLSEIKKYYGNFLAVDRLSVGVAHGECFGLLGVNGAGKTTTFKMMTGDHTVSAGDAFLEGFSVKRNIKEVQQRLGYCPQFDALIEQMTVEETLFMYARLRGVEESTIRDVVERLITSLLLKDYATKQAGDLSGGNKRKLSTAIALVGDPPIVFLDEPTTGMDPVARRLLWDTLTQVRASGRTLILTSHSMEECEALCTRIAIMVNGQFKCLGSTQHLKNKFGEGYTLMTKVGGTTEAEIAERTRALMDFVQLQFPNNVLKDVHQGLTHYQILEPSLTWAHLFGVMEQAKGQYNIEDYSVSQTTLEQVFINFARTQRPPTLTEMGCGTKCCNCCRFVFCGGCCSDKDKRT